MLTVHKYSKYHVCHHVGAVCAIQYHGILDSSLIGKISYMYAIIRDIFSDRHSVAVTMLSNLLGVQLVFQRIFYGQCIVLVNA